MKYLNTFVHMFSLYYVLGQTTRNLIKINHWLLIWFKWLTITMFLLNLLEE